MKQLAKRLRGSLAAIAVFYLLMIAAGRLEPYALLGLYLAAEKTGLTPPSAVGAMQILGHYLQGPSAWVRFTVQVLASLVAIAPALWLSLLVYQRLAFGGLRGDGATYCGACGETLKGLAEPVCPACETAI